MALSATNRSRPDGGNRCHLPGWQKKKKNRDHEKPQFAAPTSQPRLEDGASAISAPGHREATVAHAHNASKCREIIKLAKCVSERRE
jgi:hypothetical protein